MRNLSDIIIFENAPEKIGYYDPRLARFIQPDTMVPDPENIQQFNRYSYVTNNPLKYRDPTGHFNVLGMLGQGLNMIFNAMGNIGSMPTTTSFNMAVVDAGSKTMQSAQTDRNLVSLILDHFSKSFNDLLRDRRNRYFVSGRGTAIGPMGGEIAVGLNIGPSLMNKASIMFKSLFRTHDGKPDITLTDIRDIRLHALISSGVLFDISAGVDAGFVQGSVVEQSQSLNISLAPLSGGPILDKSANPVGFGLGLGGGPFVPGLSYIFSGNEGNPSLAWEISVGDIIDFVTDF